MAKKKNGDAAAAATGDAATVERCPTCGGEMMSLARQELLKQKAMKFREKYEKVIAQLPPSALK